jgi:outer membrane protein TolC
MPRLPPSSTRFARCTWPARRTLAGLATALLLGACASVSTDPGFEQVAAATRPHLPQDLAWARSEADLDRLHERITQLLTPPLTADAAVQVALLNHRGLQARYQDLGLTAAQVMQATRWPNPGLSLARVRESSGELEFEGGLHLNLARLILTPWVAELEARRLEQLRREVAMEVLAHAAETRKAHVQAVAAEESLRYMRQVRQAAEASAELARRMEQVGNFNKLARAREQAFYAEASLGLARAEQVHRAARERLVRLLGLWGTQTQFALPPRLPDLPATPRDEPEIERRAVAQRLDIEAARLHVAQTARQLGLTRQTRFINVFELGTERSRKEGETVKRAWEIGLELPLFDWGTARVAQAEALYMQAMHRAAQTAIEARSQVREAYGQYRSAYDIARHHREEIVPLKKRISEEQLLRYNGMLIGVFELLADARSQITSVNAAIDALRDFWLAQADLDMALVGRVALAAPAGPAPAAASGADAGH